MLVVRADLSECQGYANCVAAAEDTFDISDDGVVQVLREEVPAGERPRLEAAVRSCPTGALVLEEA